MKPKYYSCFFLFLFSCKQEHRETYSSQAQDNFCNAWQDIYKKNDPAQCSTLAIELVKSYESTFWSLQTDRAILKRLFKQESNHSQIYDFIYALVENKFITKAEVQNIVQYIKDSFPKVYALLNNDVCEKLKTYVTPDTSTMIIAEVFNLGFDNSLRISNKDIFNSNNLKIIQEDVNLDNLTETSQVVNYINKENYFNKTSLTKLMEVANDDFNDAIQYINPSYKGTGDDMMKAFENKNFNLDDKGLQSLANKISDDNKINAFDRLKNLIQSLGNVLNLDSILDKTNNIKINDDFLKELIKLKNCNDLLTYTDQQYFDDKLQGDDVIEAFDSCPGIKLTDGALKNVLSMIDDAKKILKTNKLMEFLTNNIIDLTVENIASIFNKSNDGIFNLDCLQNLIDKKDQDVFNKIFSNIPEQSLDAKLKGNEVLNALNGSTIQINSETLPQFYKLINNNNPNSNILSNDKPSSNQSVPLTYNGGKKKKGKKNPKDNKQNTYSKAFSGSTLNQIDISKKSNTVDSGTLMQCLSHNFDLTDVEFNDFFKEININTFDLSCLKTLIKANKQDVFDKIFPYIPDEKLSKNLYGDKVIEAFDGSTIQLNSKTLPKLCLLIKKKISDNDILIDFLNKNIDLTDKNNIKSILEKYNNGKFDHVCLTTLIQKGQAVFNRIFPLIPQERLDTLAGDDVLQAFANSKIKLTYDALKNVVSMIDDDNKISDAGKLMEFLSKNVDLTNDTNIDLVLDKFDLGSKFSFKNFFTQYSSNNVFNFDCLQYLVEHADQKAFNAIIKYCKNKKGLLESKKYKAEDILTLFIDSGNIRLDNKDSIDAVLDMIKDDSKMSDCGILFNICSKNIPFEYFYKIAKFVDNLDGSNFLGEFESYFKLICSDEKNIDKNKFLLLNEFVKKFSKKIPKSSKISINNDDNAITLYRMLFLCYINSITSCEDIIKKIEETSQEYLKKFANINNLAWFNKTLWDQFECKDKNKFNKNSYTNDFKKKFNKYLVSKLK